MQSWAGNRVPGWGPIQGAGGLGRGLGDGGEKGSLGAGKREPKTRGWQAGGVLDKGPHLQRWLGRAFLVVPAGLEEGASGQGLKVLASELKGWFRVASPQGPPLPSRRPWLCLQTFLVVERWGGG